MKTLHSETLESQMTAGAFPLATEAGVAPILLDTGCSRTLTLGAEAFAGDLQAVTGHRPEIRAGTEGAPEEHVVIVGEIGRSAMLSRLGEENLLAELDALEGGWERFLISVVEDPFPGQNVQSALVIAGSDRRGTVYGLFELSRLFGVSPWVWWADVPVVRRSQVFLKPGCYVSKEPSVRYRGIFINDEIFGLGPWAKKTFEPEQDHLGPRLYAKVCELLLRLKANLLIPAMKRRFGPFNAIPENREVADAHGIVIGSAHSEPLAMSTFDWKEERDGPWDYLNNGPRMLEFLEERVAEGKDCERLYTVGLRGVDDHGMAGDLKPVEQVRVLREVLEKQRRILKRQHQQAPEAIPQVLWLYKEVLENYDLGLEPPKDVTLIWPDDNYGYIRRLPGERDAERSGGHGVYYHLSYLGRPFDYLWLSGVDPALMHSELTKAWEFGARQVWIFNVGDIKPLEYELTLAMDLAWDIHAIDSHALISEYPESFFSTHLGKESAGEIAAIRTECSRLAGLRKPEHMGWERIEQRRLPVEAELSWITGEAETLLRAWDDLAIGSRAILQQMPDERWREAYLHLLHYRVAGSAAMARKWLLMARYAWHARQGRASAAASYQAAWDAFREIWDLTDAYMNAADGKWREWHGMFAFDTYGEPRYRTPEEEKRWIRPDPFEPLESLPAIPEIAEMGIWCRGQDERLGLGPQENRLPCLLPGGAECAFLEIFNKGSIPFDWHIECDVDWLEITSREGRCGPDQRIMVRLLPEQLQIPGSAETALRVIAGSTTIEVRVPAFLPDPSDPPHDSLPIETRGSVTLPCTAFSDKHEKPGYHWETVPGPGPTGQLIRIADVAAPALEGEWQVKENNPYLEYHFRTVNRGWMEVSVAVLPTFPATRERGSLFAVALNDGPELVIDSATRHRDEAWMRGVEYNTTRHLTRHFVREPGPQVLRIYLIDTTLCFQEVTVSADVPRSPWAESLSKLF